MERASRRLYGRALGASLVAGFGLLLIVAGMAGALAAATGICWDSGCERSPDLVGTWLYAGVAAAGLGLTPVGAVIAQGRSDLPGGRRILAALPLTALSVAVAFMAVGAGAILTASTRHGYNYAVPGIVVGTIIWIGFWIAATRPR